MKNTVTLKNLILDKVVVSGNKVEYPFRAADALKKYFTKDKITIEYDTDMSGVPESILSIPFIGSLAGLMLRGLLQNQEGLSGDAFGPSAQGRAGALPLYGKHHTEDRKKPASFRRRNRLPVFLYPSRRQHNRRAEHLRLARRHR